MAAKLDFNLFHIQGIQVGIQAEVSAILSIWIYRRRKVPQHEHQSPWGRSGHRAGSRDHGSQNIRQAAAREGGAGRQPCWGALVPGGHRAPQTGQRLQGESEALNNLPSSHLAYLDLAMFYCLHFSVAAGGLTWCPLIFPRSTASTWTRRHRGSPSPPSPWPSLPGDHRAVLSRT